MKEDFDPFRVLGIPVGSDEEAIRRRYRQLVRKHHPDVSSDPEKAHERFVRIQRAYEVLTDPDERAVWERRAEPWNVEADEVSVGGPATQFDELIADGRRLMRQGNYREARTLVARAIELNPFDAGAYRLLGDIYKAAGDMQMCLDLYREAEHLDGRRAAHREHPDQPTRKGPAIAPEPAGIRLPVLGVGVVGVVVAWSLMVGTSYDANPWSFSAWGVAGAFLAALAGVGSGLVESIDELFGLAGDCPSGQGSVPGELQLIVLSVVSPVLGFAYFVVSSIITESLCKGMLKVYAITFAGAFLARQATGEAVLFMFAASSICFVSALAGWIAGSFFTPREWWRG